MTKDVDMTKRPKVRWKYKIAVCYCLLLPSSSCRHSMLLTE
ncbi:hypothetical protein HMPREF1146_1758 [Prevotella sp. MSX73]|uniref:Uncharacterized protein n=1 Tax=Segatella buccae ATCC 33574 TaxID=873513 RepID=E6K418_9BACT|nr:hypothetical protein HMPREF6485_0363 [Segatella buccae ATCC 33574]EJP31650.1 hypothetical protein HMPREF1146_1758 [Prevotella sp. MSX73]